MVSCQEAVYGWANMCLKYGFVSSFVIGVDQFLKFVKGFLSPLFVVFGDNGASFLLGSNGNGCEVYYPCINVNI